ncbi:unnamed protein product, partial [Didymodactylos carnosus]
QDMKNFVKGQNVGSVNNSFGQHHGHRSQFQQQHHHQHRHRHFKNVETRSSIEL